jgi:transposase
MQSSSACTPTRDHHGTIFVSIELSQRSWLVTIHSPDRDRLSRYALAGGDHAGLLAVMEKVRARATLKLGSPPAVVSCYEAGYDGFWLHRLLTAAGITNLVFDPASIAVEQRARRAKTDRIDGELLLRTLLAHWRGEPRVVRIVRVPSVEQEDARRASRERDWLNWLDRQRDWQGCPIPPHLRAEVTREHARLMLVRDQLAALAPRLEASAVSTAPSQPQLMTERRNRLLRLKGIGEVFAGTLTSEVFYKDFRNRREVAGYCGLAPSPWRSGGIVREQGISKAGNPRARHKAIELAWLWLLHQRDSALSRWFRERTAQASGRIKRIAIVALARKLIVALWRYLTTGLVPDQAVMKA